MPNDELPGDPTEAGPPPYYYISTSFADLIDDAKFEVGQAGRAYSDDPGKQKRMRIMRIQNAIDILNTAMGTL